MCNIKNEPLCNYGLLGSFDVNKCKDIDCINSKCTTLVGDIDNGEVMCVWGMGYTGSLCIFLTVLL